MGIEFARLALGLAIMAFHRPLASFLIEQEHVLVGRMRRSGLHLPNPLKTSTAANILFVLGLYVVCIVGARIWSLAH